MSRVTLPGTDLSVSPVCIGTWQFNNDVQTADKTWPAQPYEVRAARSTVLFRHGRHSLRRPINSAFIQFHVDDQNLFVFVVKVSKSIVDAALENGINFFDTAQVRS